MGRLCPLFTGFRCHTFQAVGLGISEPSTGAPVFRGHFACHPVFGGVKLDANMKGSFEVFIPLRIVPCLGWCQMTSVLSSLRWEECMVSLGRGQQKKHSAGNRKVSVLV